MSVAAPDLRAASPSRPRCADCRRLGDRRREPRGLQRSLVVDQGCDVRVGHVRIEPRTVLALLEWLPLTHGDLAQLERDEALLLDGLAALAVVLRPPTIWSAADALAARRRLPGAPVPLPALLPALDRYAARQVGPRHVRRLRRAAQRIAAQLPLDGHEAASAVLAEGCAAVAGDDATCVQVAAGQLVRYMTCELVGRL